MCIWSGTLSKCTLETVKRAAKELLRQWRRRRRSVKFSMVRAAPRPWRTDSASDWWVLELVEHHLLRVW